VVGKWSFAAAAAATAERGVRLFVSDNKGGAFLSPALLRQCSNLVVASIVLSIVVIGNVRCPCTKCQPAEVRVSSRIPAEWVPGHQRVGSRWGVGKHIQQGHEHKGVTVGAECEQ
jgi:hypothetical protein